MLATVEPADALQHEAAVQNFVFLLSNGKRGLMRLELFDISLNLRAVSILLGSLIERSDSIQCARYHATADQWSIMRINRCRSKGSDRPARWFTRREACCSRCRTNSIVCWFRLVGVVSVFLNFALLSLLIFSFKFFFLSHFSLLATCSQQVLCCWNRLACLDRFLGIPTNFQQLGTAEEFHWPTSADMNAFESCSKNLLDLLCSKRWQSRKPATMSLVHFYDWSYFNVLAVRNVLLVFTCETIRETATHTYRQMHLRCSLRSELLDEPHSDFSTGSVKNSLLSIIFLQTNSFFLVPYAALCARLRKLLF